MMNKNLALLSNFFIKKIKINKGPYSKVISFILNGINILNGNFKIFSIFNLYPKFFKYSEKLIL